MGKMKDTAAEELAASIVAASASWQGQKYARMAKGLSGVFKSASGITAGLLKSTNPSATQKTNIERTVTVLDSLEAISEIATAMVQWNADNKAPSGAKLAYLQNLASNPISLGETAGAGDLSYSVVQSVYNNLIDKTLIEGSSIVNAGSSINLVVKNATVGGTWAISPVGIATIKSGTVKGVKAGRCVVTYTNGTEACSHTVDVLMTLQGARTVKKGDEITLTPNGDTAETAPVPNWISLNDSVAVVSNHGKVTGKNPGTAIIKYTDSAKNIATASITVTE